MLCVLDDLDSQQLLRQVTWRTLVRTLADQLTNGLRALDATCDTTAAASAATLPFFAWSTGDMQLQRLQLASGQYHGFFSLLPAAEARLFCSLSWWTPWLIAAQTGLLCSVGVGGTLPRIGLLSANIELLWPLLGLVAILGVDEVLLAPGAGDAVRWQAGWLQGQPMRWRHADDAAAVIEQSDIILGGECGFLNKKLFILPANFSLHESGLRKTQQAIYLPNGHPAVALATGCFATMLRQQQVIASGAMLADTDVLLELYLMKTIYYFTQLHHAGRLLNWSSDRCVQPVGDLI